MKRSCSICNAKHKAKGFCNDHYQNFKTTGSPFGKTGRRRRNSIQVLLDIISKIIPNENGCQIWPMGINSAGYGHFSIKDRSYNVSRLIYYTLNPCSEKNLVIRHKCDVRSCCNIAHLESGSQKDNIQDASKRNRLRIGKENNKAVLNEELVLYCRASYPEKSTFALSKELRVSIYCISSAISGKTWKHLPGYKKIISNNSAKGTKQHKSKLTDEIVLKIFSEYPSKTGTQLAIEYGVTHGTIYAILNKRIWRHLWE